MFIFFLDIIKYEWANIYKIYSIFFTISFCFIFIKNFVINEKILKTLFFRQLNKLKRIRIRHFQWCSNFLNFKIKMMLWLFEHFFIGAFGFKNYRDVRFCLPIDFGKTMIITMTNSFFECILFIFLSIYSEL